MDGIFISYRRDDSAGYAGRLYDRLAAHFGVDRVFMDVEGIEPGTDFIVAIEKALRSCRVLIVLIGDEWLDIRDVRGRRRLDDPNDFIRIETGTALERDIRVVPVLLDGTPMPDADALPDDLKSLVRRHAVELTHKQWEATSGELIATLEKILQQNPAPVEPAPGGGNQAPSTPATAPSKASRGAKRWLAFAALAITLVLALAYWVAKPINSVSVDTDSSRLAVERTTSPPRLSSPQTQLGFGEVLASETKHLEWLVRNEGGTSGSVEIVLDGPDASVFSTPVDTCSAGIRKDSQCSISVRYQPVAPGAHSARLTVRTQGSSTAVALVGLATETVASPPPTAPQAPSTPPEPPATPAAPPAATVKPKPSIEDIKLVARDGGVTLCHETRHATELRITPGNIVANDPARGCIEIPLSTTTTLTVTASSAHGQTSKRITASPAAPTAAAGDSRLPSPGDRWIYQTRGKWANSPKRTVSVTVDKVEDALIYESMALKIPNARPGGSKRSSRTRPAIIDWTWLGWEFAPWLAAGDALKTARWRGFSVPDVGAHWTNWRGEAEVVGRETVTVPAGRFDTIKVKVLAQRRQSGSQIEADVEPTQTKLTVWYSPKTKRYVKMERIIDAASGTEIERDQIELIEYRTQ